MPRVAVEAINNTKDAAADKKTAQILVQKSLKSITRKI